MNPSNSSVEKSMEFTLKDEQGRPLNGIVEVMKGGGLNLRFEGYGDCTTATNSGSPLFVDFYDGKLQVLVWDNINEENPSHKISLEGARENLYKG